MLGDPGGGRYCLHFSELKHERAMNIMFIQDMCQRSLAEVIPHKQ